MLLRSCLFTLPLLSIALSGCGPGSSSSSSSSAQLEQGFTSSSSAGVLESPDAASDSSDEGSASSWSMSDSSEESYSTSSLSGEDYSTSSSYTTSSYTSDSYTTSSYASDSYTTSSYTSDSYTTSSAHSVGDIELSESSAPFLNEYFNAELAHGNGLALAPVNLSNILQPMKNAVKLGLAYVYPYIQLSLESGEQISFDGQDSEMYFYHLAEAWGGETLASHFDASEQSQAVYVGDKAQTNNYSYSTYHSSAGSIDLNRQSNATGETEKLAQFYAPENHLSGTAHLIPMETDTDTNAVLSIDTIMDQSWPYLGVRTNAGSVTLNWVDENVTPSSPITLSPSIEGDVYEVIHKGDYAYIIHRHIPWLKELKYPDNGSVTSTLNQNQQILELATLNDFFPLTAENTDCFTYTNLDQVKGLFDIILTTVVDLTSRAVQTTCVIGNFSRLYFSADGAFLLDDLERSSEDAVDWHYLEFNDGVINYKGLITPSVESSSWPAQLDSSSNTHWVHEGPSTSKSVEGDTGQSSSVGL